MRIPLWRWLVPLVAIVCLFSASVAATGESAYRSPLQISVSSDGRYAYVVNHTADSISVLDVVARKVIDEISVGSHPAHAVLSPDGRLLYVTSLYGGRVDVLNLKERRITRTFSTGYEPYGITVSPDGERLYVANSVSNSVSIIEVRTGETISEISSGSSPRFIALTPDGSRLAVSNGLLRNVAIIDTATGKVNETRDLGKAAILRQIAISPDGEWAFVAHLVSQDARIPTQPERGRIHSNGFSVLALDRPSHRVTFLLDRLLVGASNPWGLAFSVDSRWLYVSLSGVHEIAIVDLEKVLRLVRNAKPEDVARLEEDVQILEKRGIARRVDAGGLGPRGLAFSRATGELLVANYFSDTVSVLDAERGEIRAVIPLGEPVPMDLWRKGELAFNDARLGFQQWFSCASCHQEDATTDGLNWDLTNDGVGNPKNVKSLHDIYDTPPAMWAGIRKDMRSAVAAGQRFLGFLPNPENDRALLEFLGNPKRAPNPFRGAPHRQEIELGRIIFAKARCGSCHPAPLFTDGKLHDLALGKVSDFHARFDTPSLRECYRTAPYLHDGRAKTLKEIFTRHDPEGFHGETKGLSEREMNELVAYLRSL